MNETKALKKQLLAAIAMVLVAALALGSATYAWFVVQNQVTAEGMMVTAQGESGIVIKSEDNENSSFASTASAGMEEAVDLKPTSTINLTDWYHAKSTEKNNAQATQVAENYAPVTEAGYVVKKKFTIRSAADEVAVTNVKLNVLEVTAEKSAASSEYLDKSLRVGVKVGDEFYVYAPLAGTNFELTANYAEAATLIEKVVADEDNDLFTLEDNVIPASDEGITAYIYLWFEGEDSNCKSSNIKASMDSLTVSVKFGTVDVE